MHKINKNLNDDIISTGKKKTDQDWIVNKTDLIEILYFLKLFVFNNLLTWICLMNKYKNKLISVDLRKILQFLY